MRYITAGIFMGTTYFLVNKALQAVAYGALKVAEKAK